MEARALAYGKKNKVKLGAFFWILVTYFFFETVRVQDVVSPVGSLKIPFLMMLSLFFYFISKGDKKVLQESIMRYYFVFLFFITVSIVWSINLGAAKKTIEVMYTFLIGGVLPVIVLLDTAQKIRTFFLYLVTANIILAIQGILSGGFGPGGYTVDENDLALALNMALPFAFMQLKVRGLGVFPKQLMMLAIIAITLGVVATSSRGGFLGLIAVFFVMWWMSKNKIRNLAFTAILGVIGFIAAYNLGFISDAYIADMQSIEDTQDETRNERFLSWVIGWEMFLNNPILGVGIENYAWNVHLYEGIFQNTGVEFKSLSGRQSHSVFFTLIPELGLIGIILFLIITLQLNKRCRWVLVSARKEPDNDDLHDLAMYAVALRISMATFFVTGTFISVLYYPHFWFLIGFTLAVELHARRLVRSPKQSRSYNVSARKNLALDRSTKRLT